MKSFIKKLLREALSEAEYNYHYGGKIDLDNPMPYGSDSIDVMSGRGTGHFGSGLYFSTYKCLEKRDIDDRYGEYSDFDYRYGGRHMPQLIQLKKGIYRVDMDLYKNLYRVKNNKHGKILFLTLKQCNELFDWAKHWILSGKIKDGLSTNYIRIQHNLNQLSLKLPPYKEFIKMLQIAAKDESDYKTNIHYPSFSTRVMEYNGFNGVNVSGVPNYDNTTHGSVIYDMSKTSSEIKKVDDVDLFCDIKSGVAGYRMDIKTAILRGDIVTNWDKLKQLPKNEQLKLMKRYNHYIYTGLVDDYIKELYFRTLAPKMRRGEMEGDLSIYSIQDLIDFGYGKMIYDPNIKVKGSSFLEYTLERIYVLPKEYGEKLVKGINRELTDYEKEALEGM